MAILQHPRLDEDAALLLAEAVLSLDALELACAGALIDGDTDALLGACEAAVMLSARARRRVAVAVHCDWDVTAP